MNKNQLGKKLGINLDKNLNTEVEKRTISSANSSVVPKTRINKVIKNLSTGRRKLNLDMGNKGDDVNKSSAQMNKSRRSILMPPSEQLPKPKIAPEVSKKHGTQSITSNAVVQSQPIPAGEKQKQTIETPEKTVEVVSTTPVNQNILREQVASHLTQQSIEQSTEKDAQTIVDNTKSLRSDYVNQYPTGNNNVSSEVTKPIVQSQLTSQVPVSGGIDKQEITDVNKRINNEPPEQRILEQRPIEEILTAPVNQPVEQLMALETKNEISNQASAKQYSKETFVNSVVPEQQSYQTNVQQYVPQQNVVEGDYQQPEYEAENEYDEYDNPEEYDRTWKVKNYFASNTWVKKVKAPARFERRDGIIRNDTPEEAEPVEIKPEHVQNVSVIQPENTNDDIVEENEDFDSMLQNLLLKADDGDVNDDEPDDVVEEITDESINKAIADFNEEVSEQEEENAELESQKTEDLSDVDTTDNEAVDNKEEQGRKSISKLDYFKYRFLNNTAVGADGKDKVEKLAQKYGTNRDSNADVIVHEGQESIKVEYKNEFNTGNLNLDFSKKGSVKIFKEKRANSYLAIAMAFIYMIIGIAVFLVIGPIRPEVVVATGLALNYNEDSTGSNLLYSKVGDKLDLSGIKIIVLYSNNTQKIVDFDESFIVQKSEGISDDYTIIKPGRHQIIVSVENHLSPIYIQGYVITASDILGVYYVEISPNNYICWAEIQKKIGANTIVLSAKRDIVIDGFANTIDMVSMQLYNDDGTAYTAYYTPELYVG